MQEPRVREAQHERPTPAPPPPHPFNTNNKLECSPFENFNAETARFESALTPLNHQNYVACLVHIFAAVGSQRFSPCSLATPSSLALGTRDTSVYVCLLSALSAKMTSSHRITSLFAITRHLFRGAGLHGTTAAHLRVTSRPIPPPIDPVGPDNVVRSPYPSVPIPECGVYQHVFSQIESNGRKVAIVDGISGREYSFNELHESVVNFSSGLNRLGFQKGDVLALCTANCTMFPVVFYGALASGGVVSTCNPAYTAEELAYQFKNSGAKYVATMAAFLPSVKKAIDLAGIPVSVIVVDDHSVLEHGYVSYQSLVTDSGSRFVGHKVDAKNDVAMLPYSSGTTGLPKGVMLTHHNLVSNAYQYCHPEYLDLSPPGTTLIGVLPFYHVYGFAIIMMSSLWQGSKLVVLPKFDPALFLSTLQKYRVNIAHLVPPIILFLAKYPDVDKYDLSSIQQIISAAAPLGGDLAKATTTRLHGRCVIRQGYGLTETSPLTHLTPLRVGMSRPATVGIPVLNQLVKVVDIDSGSSLPSGQEGEIYMKGPNIMKGYLNQPDATKKTLTEDGWLKTGDIGYFDQGGFFYITDRLKELIKVKGLQVAPAELEALLQNHPKVADAAVIGVPHERHGEAPRAFVVKRDPTLTEKELADYIASHVSEHKHLTGGVKFIEAVPKTTSGKILRRLLKSIS
eukprot:Em0017g215a